MGALDHNNGNAKFAALLVEHGLPNILQEIQYYLACAKDGLKRSDLGKSARIDYLEERMYRLWEDVNEELADYSWIEDADFLSGGAVATELNAPFNSAIGRDRR